MQNVLEFEKLLKNIVPHCSIEIPPDIQLGHLTTNAPMVSGKNHNKVKSEVIHLLNSLSYIDKYEYVQPGFINMFFKHDILDHLSNNINVVNNISINIEYCSPNPTGPLHLGHYRGTIIGDCIARLLSVVGYNVTKEIYINDQGVQVDLFVESILYHYYNLINIKHDRQLHYKGEYVKDLAQNLIDYNIKPTQQNIINMNLKSIFTDLSIINVKHDIITYESSLYGDLEEVIKILDEKKMLTIGQVNNQKISGNNLIIDNKVLKRADGKYTYFAFDIAYHYNKFKRGFQKQICVLGEDHAGHIDHLQKVLHKLDINLQVIKVFIVQIYKNNTKLVMSKREGSFISITEMLTHISNDCLKLLILSKNNNKMIEMNFDNLSTTQNKSFFYIEYAINSISNTKFIDNPFQYNKIDEEILSYIIYWPKVIQLAVQNLDIHKLLIFAVKLSQKVHALESIDHFNHKKQLLKNAINILLIIKQIINI